MAKSTSQPIATSKPSKLAKKPVVKEAAPEKADVAKSEEVIEAKAAIKVISKAKTEGDDKGETQAPHQQGAQQERRTPQAAAPP